MPTYYRGARRWTDADIEHDVLTGIAEFRDRRIAESQEQLETIRTQIETACRTTLPILHRITGAKVDRGKLADILRDPEASLILRCIGTPPISSDDLKTLAQGAVNQTAVRRDQALADRVGEVLSRIRDFKRFPWLQDDRPPTADELEKAELATATLAAASKILTHRRNDERSELEMQVHDLLARHLVEIPAQPITSIRSGGPQPGEFMRNALIGAHGVDAIVGLPDYRLLCIECKSSNSEINSRKRLNKEVGSVAKASLAAFGEDVITAAVIRGVFKVAYVRQAQAIPVVIFWSHRLSDLVDFIEDTTDPAF